MPDLWAGDTVEQFPHWMTCPRGAGDPIQAVGTDKLEAVRNAIIKALRTYVYGVGPDNKPVKELEGGPPPPHLRSPLGLRAVATA